MDNQSHTFHIAVMGTGYTIDTPLHVARYGISSVVSLVDDILIEQMRKVHCQLNGEPYEEITNDEESPRSHRITAYMNLLNKLISRQVKELQSSPFEDGSEITKYYELLPDSPLKQVYLDMLAESDGQRKLEMQDALRKRAVPGTIDVNIMTKLDCDTYRNGEKRPGEFSDAMTALRGFAESDVEASIVFSAGMNAKLYSYAGSFDGFFPDGEGKLKKKIVLKVSDYRSAAIQGKFLAKRGLWISEYRVESSLNCGGHAFATDGYLIGPILEEFKANREKLTESLHGVYTKALTSLGKTVPGRECESAITFQGGIGTAFENSLMTEYYKVDRTGWGTPFLLVPEVVNVDDEHLAKLQAARDEDVYLSDASPMGIPFWNLRNCGSEEMRRQRIAEGKPGAPCRKTYIAENTEFTDIPICKASRAYVKLKLEHLPKEGHDERQYPKVEEDVLSTSCICHDLAGGATIKYGIDPKATPALCCGPNIVDYSKIVTFCEMVGHIYGRVDLMTNPDRPHVFIRELSIYVDYLRKEVEKLSLGLVARTPKYFHEFKENLFSGIEYYTSMAGEFVDQQRDRFLDDLVRLRTAIEGIPIVEPIPANKS